MTESLNRSPTLIYEQKMVSKSVCDSRHISDSSPFAICLSWQVSVMQQKLMDTKMTEVLFTSEHTLLLHT